MTERDNENVNELPNTYNSREGGNPESLFFTNGGKEKDAGSPIKDVGDDRTMDIINECVTTDT